MSRLFVAAALLEAVVGEITSVGWYLCSACGTTAFQSKGVAGDFVVYVIGS